MTQELLTRPLDKIFIAPLGAVTTSGVVEFTPTQQIAQTRAAYSPQPNPSVAAEIMQPEIQPISEIPQPTIGERVRHIAENLGRVGLLTAELFIGTEILGWLLKRKPKDTPHHTFIAA